MAARRQSQRPTSFSQRHDSKAQKEQPAKPRDKDSGAKEHKRMLDEGVYTSVFASNTNADNQ
jgi:hypothetical protein